MKTFTGRIIDPLNLRPEDVDIVDIAHHLSHECRFAGATPWHYSVAQHSIYVSQYNSYCLGGCCGHGIYKFLHDAPEAYLKDIPAPIKNTEHFGFYRDLEDINMGVILDALGIPRLQNWVLPPCVKVADRAVCVREGIELMNTRYTHYEEYPANITIERWTPDVAKQAYLATFRKLHLEKV